MTHSYSEKTSLKCSHCGETFEIEVWLIVDVKNSPELADKVKDDSLFVLECTHCKKEVGESDSPLMLFRSEFKKPLFFYPPQDTTPEEDQNLAIDLLKCLRLSLGDEWNDEWIEDGVKGVLRSVLPLVVSIESEEKLGQELDQAMDKIAEEATNTRQSMNQVREQLDTLSAEVRLGVLLESLRTGQLPEMPINKEDLNESFFKTLDMLEEEAKPNSGRKEQLKKLREDFIRLRDQD